jgi:hypothetical protein
VASASSTVQELGPKAIAKVDGHEPSFRKPCASNGRAQSIASGFSLGSSTPVHDAHRSVADPQILASLPAPPSNSTKTTISVASARKDDDEELTIPKILSREQSLSTKMNGIRMKAAAAGRNGNSVLAQDYKNFIAACSAADVLQNIAKLKKSSIADAIKMAELLMSLSHNLPSDIARAITVMQAEISFDLTILVLMAPETNRVEVRFLWVNVSRMWLADDEVLTDWLPSKANMRNLPPSPDVEGDAANMDISFLECFFNERSVRLVAKIGAAKTDPTERHSLANAFLEFAKRYLDSHTSNSLKGESTYADAIANQLAGVCRGFVKLISHIPMDYSATVEDVLLLMPKGSCEYKGPSLTSEFDLPAAKVMMETMAASDIWTSEFLLPCMRKAAVEELHGPLVHKLHSQLFAAKGDEQLTVLGKVANEIPELRSQLRPRSLIHIDSLAIDIMTARSEKMCTEIDGMEKTAWSTCLSDLQKYWELMKKLDLQELENHKANLEDRSVAILAFDAQFALERQLTMGIRQESDATCLSRALDKMQGKLIPVTLIPALVEARQNVYMFAAAMLSSEPLARTTPTMLDEAYAVVQKVSPLVVKNCGGPTVDGPAQKALKVVGDSILGLRTVLDQMETHFKDGVKKDAVFLLEVIKLLDMSCEKLVRYRQARATYALDTSTELVSPSYLKDALIQESLNKMIFDAVAYEVNLASLIKTHHHIQIARALSDLRLRCDHLEVVNGGHPTRKKTVWYEGHEDELDLEKLLVVAASTIDVCKGKFIDECAVKVQDGLKDYEVLSLKYAEYTDDSSTGASCSKPGIADELIRRAKLADARSKLTKCEALLVKTFALTKAKSFAERADTIAKQVMKFNLNKPIDKIDSTYFHGVHEGLVALSLECLKYRTTPTKK